MAIKTSYLKDLSEQQLAFSSAFLEDVFLHQKTGLSEFRPEDLTTLGSLIAAMPTTTMKKSVLNALDTPIQVQLSQKMDDEELHLLFTYLQDIPILKLIFQSLPDHRKEPLIQQLFQQDKKLFNELKSLMEPSQTLPLESPLPSHQDLGKLIQREIQVLVKMIDEPIYTVSDLKSHVSALEKQIAIEHFDIIAQRVIAGFMSLNIPLTDKNTFASHVKFYTFLVPYLIIFPSLNVVVLHPLDAFLNALNRLPNGGWVVKVINQLPPSIIKLCLDRLKSHPRIPELQKRQVYSKLLGVIYENIHIKEGAQLRAYLEG